MNGVVVTLVVLAILASRKGKKEPVKLDLSGSGGSSPHANVSKPGELTGTAQQGASNPSSQTEPSSSQGQAHEQGRQQRQPPPGWENYRPRSKPQAEAQQPSQPPPEKNLNVVFNWNGHSWDAYEVLGIPAGSSREAATTAFHAVSAKSDPESLPFLTAAYEAILKG